MKVSVAIMHHPSRASLLTELIYALGPGVPVTVVADLDSRGPWFTAERAWAAVAAGASHHLVIQDDVEPTPNLIRAVHRVIEAVPDVPVGLYHTAKRPIAEQAFARGDDFFVLGDGPSGPALLMPHMIVSDFLRWQRWHVDSACPNDDLRVAMYCICTDQPIWFTSRSLVRHRDVQSVYRKRSSTERATMGGHAFIGPLGAQHTWHRPDDPARDMRYGGNYARWLDEPSKVQLRDYVKKHGRFVADTKLWE